MFFTLLQILGLATVIAGAFLISIPAGIIAVGGVCIFVGLAGDR